MLFNSLDFGIFLPIVFVLYWFVLGRHYRAQNLLIAVASYIFYGWWDWRFLSLIFFSTCVDYLVGRRLAHTEGPGPRRVLLTISLVINLGMLGFFKYYNFFVDSFVNAFTFFGSPVDARPLAIVLPVGISFYTFQTLSYTIDVYRRKLEATRNFIDFSAFVSFFPQLVAGPIERANNLLPQFYHPRTFNERFATDGCRQILVGLFKKVVIADSCAVLANDIFTNYESYNSATLALGAVFFAVQIYGDFSGYTDIAIGTARLFGFDLMKNFDFPYFSRDIAEFWRRWHISLSTWFRDYLYFPLGGSRGSKGRTVRNIFIIFLVSGFWHGANWTFVIWGFLHACFYLPLLLFDLNRNHTDTVAEDRWFPSLSEALKIALTFALVTFAWIFFRAENLTHAMSYIGHMFGGGLSEPFGFQTLKPLNLLFVPFMGLLFLWEWVARRREHALDGFGARVPVRALRWSVYVGIIFVVIIFSGGEQQFIYFQF
ncbi:MBOAT family O-acyltransferase [Lewinella sp. IMCC34183]|uniref:MBOAT family O-acyltransferase n=1 Tax=Lewinella sp. IMCC34183 TaxID=2248762 RepID=UPI000E24FDAE|nr:MBOAT family protein [Lewinella sp. IMCC34183]